jgi:hypothetical protein
MALPANIRVNVAVPFPAMVQGSGLITMSKINGVWTINASVAQLQAVGLAPQNFQGEFVPIFDAGIGAWFKVSLANLGIGGGRVQRSITSSPIVLIVGDQILMVNINTGAPTCTLPQASTRNGVPLTFKDVGGQFGAHNLTITPFAGDTIDGAASLVLNINRQGVTLVPFNDAVDTGWAII